VFGGLRADTAIVGASLDKLARDKRLMAYTAAAMYGGATLDALLEGLLPGDPSFAIAPGIVAAVIVVALIAGGPRLPRWALAPLGPLGVGLIAGALATTPGAGDGAVLYVWPVLWTTFFFGRRGALAIVLCIGVAHVGTLLALPAASSYPGRWLDVMVSVCVLAIVVLTLIDRNDRLLAQLADEARTDALTGLLNRRGFDERAQLERARARREQRSIAVVTFDIDHFKRVNDEWGHEVGDRVLVRTGRLIAEQSRDIDVVARFGGEEFVVLLPGSDAAEARLLAERVRSVLIATGTRVLPGVRVSAGIAAAVAPESIDGMLQGADMALYGAKRSGRDRAMTFESERPPLELAHTHRG
jgi:diguanylate cyclase (GGDEF)-like protein